MLRDRDEAALRGLLEELIRDVLGFPIGLDASFFEAGLTSATLLVVHQRLEAELGRDVPVLLLFRHPTRRALARWLAGAPPAFPTGISGPASAGTVAPTVADARRALRDQIRGTRR